MFRVIKLDTRLNVDKSLSTRIKFYYHNINKFIAK